MNKHTVITLVAVAVIVSPFLYSAISIYGAQHMEYRWSGPKEFTYFAMSNHGDVEFCNRVPFWVSVENFEITSFYRGNNIGSYSVSPMTMDPLASAVQNGTFTSDRLAASQHVFMTIDFELVGGDIRIDPSQLIMVARADTPILGLVQYSTTTQLDVVDFKRIMDGTEWSCG